MSSPILLNQLLYSDGTEVSAPSDTSEQSEIIQHLENIEYNQTQIFYGLQAVCSSVNTLLLVVVVVTAFKLLWTAVAKWLFGGV